MGWVRVMRVRVGLSTLTQDPRAGQRSQPEPNPFAGSGWVGFGLARVLAQPNCHYFGQFGFEYFFYSESLIFIFFLGLLASFSSSRKLYISYPSSSQLSTLTHPCIA